MASVDTDAQVVASPLVLTWENVLERAANIKVAFQNARFYGVPRGGSIVAGLLGRPVDNIDGCDIIVDDIIDSGRTRDFYTERFKKPFVALIDKNDEQLIGRWVVFPWELEARNDIHDTIIRQLQYIGEDARRESLRQTPERVVRSWGHLYAGYQMEPASILAKRFAANHHELVILKHIEFYSTCEHHLLPFVGHAHIGYIPNGAVVGISKIARLLECFARRLQIQEQLCSQIVDALMKHLNPVGAACVLEAQHFCMTSRGVNKQQSTMVTSAVRGVFETDVNARQEFLRLIEKGA